MQKYEVAYTEKWDLITLSRAPITGDDERDRTETLSSVNDPAYWDKLAAQAAAEREARARNLMDEVMEGELDL